MQSYLHWASLFACAFAHQGRRASTAGCEGREEGQEPWLKRTGSLGKTESQVSSETGECETALGKGSFRSRGLRPQKSEAGAMGRESGFPNSKPMP